MNGTNAASAGGRPLAASGPALSSGSSRHAVPLGAAAVLRAADVRQDGAAQARRLAVGVGGVDVLLPGGAAGRLLLCACAEPLSSPARWPRSSIWRCSALALLALPIGLAERRAEPPAGDAYCWLIGVLALGVGLPFFAVSANAPLLQAWFARTGHPHAQRPLLPLWRLQSRQPASRCSPIRSLIEPLLGLGLQAGALDRRASWLLAGDDRGLRRRHGRAARGDTGARPMPRPSQRRGARAG